MAHLEESFDRIYVINLAHRRDRYEEVGEQLRRVGLGWDAPKVERFDAVRPADAGGFPSVGARGCFFSHLGVLRAALQQRHRSVLILEDDCNFVDEFQQRWPVVHEALCASDWAFLHGGVGGKRTSSASSTSGLRRLGGAEAVQTTHFIALRGRAIELLPTYLQRIAERPPGHSDGGPMHVDGAYSWFLRAHPQLECFIADPALAYQRSSRTDIHALAWRDRVPVVRDVVAWARKLNNRRRRA